MPILFEGRYRRARDLQREQRAKRSADSPERPLNESMEKGDLLAMILAALITILPVALLVLLVITAAGYFFLFR